ncbi:hypothetical protein BABINDRAFT_163808 [Babjeviella inositovora NRRL Y-12698]|uniref:Uncharacterized protein n=1 Tax=Babjeviella inositovora NRRL Y-12698 TaxID=984486 RepID=A0A1E3QH86_9ASCO|nr:uncharacterized protein BABINDRAFT_163808 [Babjeviella inositovora NRRL Y-12698]ODQ77073.1 hypothetical protein BABINDRAFT_163808 [Babjeviella inositovora NRRL Y-12698]
MSTSPTAANQISWRLQKLKERQLAAKNKAAGDATTPSPSGLTKSPKTFHLNDTSSTSSLGSTDKRDSIIGSKSFATLDTASSAHSDGLGGNVTRKFNLSHTRVNESDSEDEVAFVLY